jgi:hypothetical protein
MRPRIVPHPPSVSAVVFHPEHSLKSSAALTLSVGGSASLIGKVEAHIVPRVEFGVSLLLGAAQASIYLEVDGYGVLDMHLTDSVTASPILIGATASTATASTSTSTNASIDASANASISNSTYAATPSTTDTATYAAGATTNTAEAPASTNTDMTAYGYSYTATTSVPVTVDNAKVPNLDKSSKRDETPHNYQGCVGLDVGVSVNGGAEGQLFNLLSGNINWNIYSQKWDIFEVSCFLSYLPDTF